MLGFTQFLQEQEVRSHIDNFIDYACKHLEIEERPEIELVNDKTHALENTSFGQYRPGEKKITVNIAGRHTADVLRTLAHEMVHHKQNLKGELYNEAGQTGSEIENEANSMAGIMMRNYGKMNSRIYEQSDI